MKSIRCRYFGKIFSLFESQTPLLCFVQVFCLKFNAMIIWLEASLDGSSLSSKSAIPQTIPGPVTSDSDTFSDAEFKSAAAFYHFRA